MVDQAPIGSTPRANPVTYLRAFDGIRTASRHRGGAPARLYRRDFSFNVAGGPLRDVRG